MPAAFPLLDLAAILTFAVIFVLALTVKQWLAAVFEVVDRLIGWAPFVGNWIKAGENHVLSALNVVVVESRAGMAACLDGLRWSLREFEIGTRDFADFVQDNWEQLVGAALPTALSLLWSATLTHLGGLEKRIDGLAGTLAGVGPAIRAQAQAAEERAINAAAGYADSIYTKAHDFTVSHVHGVYTELEGDIAGARQAAEAYTDTALADLRRAEDAAIAAATSAATTALATVKGELAGRIGELSAALAAARGTLEGELTQLGRDEQAALAGAVASVTTAIGGAEAAAETAATAALSAEAHTLEQALAAGEAAASSALTAAQATLESELGAASKAAAAELHATATTLAAATAAAAGDARAIAAQLAAAESAAAGELEQIYNLPADALRGLLDNLDLTKVAGFGAGLVLVRGLVNAIARESGLDSAECRAKNKQICGLGGDEWGDLLAGGAFLTGALSLAELVVPARVAVHELAALMRQAA